MYVDGVGNENCREASGGDKHIVRKFSAPQSLI